MTDLGLAGNNRAEEQISRWMSRRKKISFEKNFDTTEKRVLLTGFGPFGCEKNISRQVLQMLANREAFPDDINFKDLCEPTSFAGMDSSVKKESQVDSAGGFSGEGVSGEVFQRFFKIGKLGLSVRLLSLSVEWNISAAIIINEIREFEPDFVLMTGLGGSKTDLRLEGQAINKTSQKSGFDFWGEDLAVRNLPVSDFILAGGSEVVDLPWDVERLSSIFKEEISELNTALNSFFDVCGAVQFDPKNSYICNHVSYLVSQYAKKFDLKLAGGAVSVPPFEGREFSAGFLHYPKPAATTPESSWNWARLVLRFMEKV